MEALDPLVELETLVLSMSAAIEARRLENMIGRTVERLADLPRQSARFEALVEASKVLGGTKNSTVKQHLEEASEEMDAIGEMLESARTVEELEHIDRELSPLTSALTGLDVAVRNLWQETVQAEFQPLVAVGELLSRIAKTKDLGVRLQSLGQKALSLSQRKPPAEQLAPAIQDLRANRADVDKELHELTGSQEVDAFLTAVTRGTATLSDVTSAVMTWLRSNDALTAFVVRGS